MPPEVGKHCKGRRQDNQRQRGAGGPRLASSRVYEDYGMRAGVEDVWGSSPLRLALTPALR